MNRHWRAKEVAELLSLVEGERRFFQGLLLCLPVAVALVTGRFGVVSANRAFRKLFGIPLAGGVLPIERIPVDGLLAAVREVLSGGNPRSWHARNVPTPGGALTLQISLKPLVGWLESVEPHVLVLVSDVTYMVTEVQRVAAAAHASAQGRVELLPAVVWRLDVSTMRFIELAEHAAIRLGLPPQHWRIDAEFWSERIHPDDLDRLCGLYKLALRGVPLTSYDYRAVAATGETLWLRDMLRFNFDLDANRTTVDGITIDLTTSRSVRESQHQAQKAEALARLAARVAMETTHTLTTVTDNSDNLLCGLAPEHPLRASAQQLLQQGDHLLAMLAGLAPADARPSPQPRSFVVDGFLNGLRDALGPSLPPGIELILRLGAGGAAVEVDQHRLREVLGTLVRRAANHLPSDGSITLSTTIAQLGHAVAESESGVEPGPVVVIRIRSSGLPIAPEALERIFEPAEEHQEESDNLASTFLTVKDNGGDLSVSSDPNQGVCFTIIFPRVAWTG